MKAPITRIASLFLISLISLSVLAQAPQRINYQAVARHSVTGAELANREVYLQVLIRSGGPSGNIVYQESHENVITDAFGLFSIHIGGGSTLEGSLSEISWGYNTHWLDISMDIGSGLLPFGAMQFVSVPYAMHAGTVSDKDDADADPTNELINDLSFNAGTSTLTIEEAGINFNVDLSALANTADADADPTNELIEIVEFEDDTSLLTIKEGGISHEIDLTTLRKDDDSDPTNELIAVGGLTLSGTTLQVVEAGITHQVDLQPLVSASMTLDQATTGWDVATAPNRVFNNTARIGIGHNTPGGQLEVRGTGPTGEAIFMATRNDGTTVFGISPEMVRVPAVAVFNIQGQVRYSPRFLNGNISYTVDATDHIVVIRYTSDADRTINLPSAAAEPGRVIKFVKVANAFNGWLTIQGPSQINFSGTQYFFDQPDISSVSFISLGANGWIELDKWEE